MAVIASAQITLSLVVDVKAVYRYYLLQSSTLTKPSKPITTPASTPSGWSAVEPTYTEGSTNSLYTVDGTVYSDNTWSWADVQLSSSYEAAKAAYNKAVAANSAANSAASTANSALNAAKAAVPKYGTCGTAAGTAAKTVSISDFQLVVGAIVTVQFTNTNTAANPTLNISSTGAKNIRMNNANLASTNYWSAGDTLTFVYDGLYWSMQSPSKVLLASNGLTGTSAKNASVSVGYIDTSTAGDMGVKADATSGTNSSNLLVTHNNVNFHSGTNTSTSSTTRLLENSFTNVTPQFASLTSSSTLIESPTGTTGTTTTTRSSVEVYPEYIDLVTDSLRLNGSEVNLSGGGGGGGVQSDWNVNDPSDPAYVKNRPFYRGAGETIEVCPQQTFTITNLETEPGPVVGAENIVAGETYTVTWNGVEYESTAVDYVGMATLLGNTAALGLVDTGEPFAIMYAPAIGINVVVPAELMSETPPEFPYTFTFAVSLANYEFVKISKSYLPDDIAYMDSALVIGGEGQASIVMNNPNNEATGAFALAAGPNSIASNIGSVAMGANVNASGIGSVAMGGGNNASGTYSVAMGQGTGARGDYSLAAGCNVAAYGECSFVFGEGLSANGEHQFVIGKNNVVDTANQYLFIAGCGTATITEARKNALTVDKAGNGWFAGNLFVGGTSQSDAKVVVTKEYVDNAIAAGGGGGGGAPTVTKMTLSETYGVFAWRNSMGVVTISSESWNNVPAGAQWSVVTFGTLPEGWRPDGLLQTPVLLNGTQHVVQVLANGTVQLVRMVAQNGAAPCIFTVTFVTA